jgi:hypothetical protein
MTRLFAVFIMTLFATGCRSPSGAQQPVAAWVEVAPGDTVQIRAITSATTCPTLMVDGQMTPMAERAAPDAAYPVRACALSVPRTAVRVALDGKKLALVPPTIHRIVLFGDTGCRLKGDQVQLCNDAVAWPFAAVAAQAAAKHPDLVIHVGDYHYRETPCPAGIAGCAGTPYGDEWGVWAKDFFEPAAPLLAAAPWVMVRGNHEACARAANGWFRFLDPGPPPAVCSDFAPPYAVHLDGFGLAVLDSAATVDARNDPARSREFGDAFASIAGRMTGPFWLVTHRPVWALVPGWQAGGADPVLSPLNLTEQAAIDSEAPPNLDMVVSGHVHTFATYDYGPTRPAQLVVGVGGSYYDKMQLAPATPVDIDGLRASAFALTQYGYLVMDRTDGGWDGTLYAAGDDRVLARCAFRGRSAECR